MELVLDTLIRDLLGSLENIAVLRLLAGQITLLLETGRTDLGEFCEALESKGFLVSDLGSSTRCIELNTFYEQVLNSITYNTLLVIGTNFRLSIKLL